MLTTYENLNLPARDPAPRKSSAIPPGQRVGTAGVAALESEAAESQADAADAAGRGDVGASCISHYT